MFTLKTNTHIQFTLSTWPCASSPLYSDHPTGHSWNMRELAMIHLLNMTNAYLGILKLCIRFLLSKHHFIETQTQPNLQLFFSFISADPTHPKHTTKKKLIIPIWNKSVQPRGSHPKQNTFRLCFLSGRSVTMSIGLALYSSISI